MKYISILLVNILFISPAFAQSNPQLNGDWKVRYAYTDYLNQRAFYFHTDSTKNYIPSYKEIIFKFNPDSLLTISYEGSDTTGRWFFNPSGDSLTIDKDTFKVQQLNDTTLITKSATLTPSYVVEGQIDTMYNYMKLYKVGGALPVTWLSFNASYGNNLVQLKWSTTSEINNVFFEIEHSNNGTQFQKIGQTEAQPANTTVLNYQFNTTNYVSGNNYYRIKQVDKDGRFSYSTIRMVKIQGGNLLSIKIYPNPTRYNLTIDIDQPEKLKKAILNLTDLSGRKVYSENIRVGNRVLVNLPELNSSTYILTIVNENAEVIHREKLVIH